jgi:peptidoglycan/xylan/chitin deacetylase (PgdA/CDA1 family)
MLIVMGFLKNSGRLAVHRFGGLHLVRWLNRRKVRILMYHGFPWDDLISMRHASPADSGISKRLLENQCRHIVKHYHPISLGRVADWLKSSNPLPANSLVVTVDDGYKNFFTAAYPVFRSYGIPVTLFLTTAFIDEQSWLWFDQIVYAFEHARVLVVEVALGPERRQLQLNSPEQRSDAGSVAVEMARVAANSERLRFLANLESMLDVKFPSRPPEAALPLTWGDIRAMKEDIVDIGAHTVTHPILSRMGDASELQYEIEHSKVRIEDELGRSVRHFCYPSGGENDISPQAVEKVRAAGYETAVTAIRCADALLLTRIGVEPQVPEAYFCRRVAGFR